MYTGGRGGGQKTAYTKKVRKSVHTPDFDKTVYTLFIGHYQHFEKGLRRYPRYFFLCALDSREAKYVSLAVETLAKLLASWLMQLPKELRLSYFI